VNATDNFSTVQKNKSDNNHQMHSNDSARLKCKKKSKTTDICHLLKQKHQTTTFTMTTAKPSTCSLPERCSPSASAYGEYENISIIPNSNDGVLRRSMNFSKCTPQCQE